MATMDKALKGREREAASGVGKRNERLGKAECFSRGLNNKDIPLGKGKDGTGEAGQQTVEGREVGSMQTSPW